MKTCCNTPHFTHNHNCCIYLGSTEPQEKEKFDFYFCFQGGKVPTVVARYGNDGPDYNSGLPSNLPQLKRAELLAKGRGLL
jgi:hypothetical protein